DKRYYEMRPTLAVPPPVGSLTATNAIVNGPFGGPAIDLDATSVSIPRSSRSSRSGRGSNSQLSKPQVRPIPRALTSMRRITWSAARLESP
ncbi:MAG TPA: hypothetical protein VHY84_20610, partial [Bryobacteraceae bacterium]|nr:hypothetical protein [Bryobacteraceae bacterium]